MRPCSIHFANSDWPSAQTFTVTRTTARTGTLTGTVTEKGTGSPIEGAAITAGTLSAAADNSGSYTIIGLLADTYTVSASAYHYQNQSDTAVITAGNTTTLDFELEPGDNTPPVITLKKIKVRGSVNDATITEVEINGVSVTVTAGAYSHEVDVTSTNAITIIATNGKEETVTKTIEIK